MMRRFVSVFLVLVVCLVVVSGVASAADGTDPERTPVGMTGGGYVPYEPPIPRITGNNILVTFEFMHRVQNLVDAVRDFADKMGAPYLLNPIIAPSW